MRIAALADVHGNLPALEAVIADLPFFSPDLVVNLGDHVSGPLWASATADLLMAQTGWLHIRGNHDRQMIELRPAAMGASDRAAWEQLSSSQKTWLASMPPRGLVADEILLCHGTPERDDEYLIEDVSTGFARVAERDQIRSRTGPASGVIACGHSHTPGFVRLDDRTLVVNPGGVGLQAYSDLEYRFPHVIETGSPHARYLLLDRHSAGWRATFRVVDYDWESAARLARVGQRPDWDYALRTGYAPR